MADMDKAVAIPSDVLVRIVDDEAVLLNLKTEFYFGLDENSTEFWHAIEAADTLNGAIPKLLEVFDVDEERLRADFSTFVDELLSNGLLEYTEPATS